MTRYLITMKNGYYNLLFSTLENAKNKISNITADIDSFTQDDFYITPIEVQGTPTYNIAYLVIARGKHKHDNGTLYNAIYISDIAYATVKDAKKDYLYNNHKAYGVKINYTKVREINIE